MYSVVCIKWGDKYSAEYVNKLYGMVKRNLSLPHRFFCFTDDPTDIRSEVEIRPLEDDLEGWWQKLTLFKPNVYDLTGRVLFLDLDIIIVDRIECFFSVDKPFVIIKDWNSRGKNIFWNSSVFSFELGTFPKVWERFIENPQQHIRRTPGGDQRWILANIPKEQITTWSFEWCRSFKYDCWEGIPEGAKVIVFHGQPNPPDAQNFVYRGNRISAGWIDTYWKE